MSSDKLRLAWRIAQSMSMPDEEFERAGMMEEFAKIKAVGNNGHSLDS